MYDAPVRRQVRLEPSRGVDLRPDPSGWSPPRRDFTRSGRANARPTPPEASCYDLGQKLDTLRPLDGRNGGQDVRVIAQRCRKGDLLDDIQLRPRQSIRPAISLKKHLLGDKQSTRECIGIIYIE